MIAVGHRVHRLAFVMLRSQRPFDADRWARAVAGHRHPTDEQARHGGTTAPGGPPARRDLPAPPTLTPRRHTATNKPQPVAGSGTVAGARTDVDVAMRHDLDP